MQTIQTSKRGGRRVGAGRPKGSGRFGEPTVPVRVPLSLADEVESFVAQGGRTLPVFDMKTFNEPMSVKVERAIHEKFGR